jgi:hypothetical protein
MSRTLTAASLYVYEPSTFVGKVTVNVGGAEAIKVSTDNAFIAFYNSTGVTRRGFIQGTATDGLRLGTDIGKIALLHNTSVTGTLDVSGALTSPSINSLLVRKQDNVDEGAQLDFEGANLWAQTTIDNYRGTQRFFAAGGGHYFANAVSLGNGGEALRINNDSAYLAFYSTGGTRRGYFQNSNGGGLTVGVDIGVLTVSGQLRSTGIIESTAAGGSVYNTASIFINTANNAATLSFHPGGVAPQFRVGYNVGTVYLRNAVDSGDHTLQGIIVNTSSRERKQDIEPWPPRPRALSSDTGPFSAESVMPLINSLRPVFYRWNHHEQLAQLPLSQRRNEALTRLNKLRTSKGLPAWDGPDTIHECGRDCDGSEAEPCHRVLNWQQGRVGLISEEVGDVAPWATQFDEHGHTGLDAVALNTIAIAALQEMDKRLALVEGQLSS